MTERKNTKQVTMCDECGGFPQILLVYNHWLTTCSNPDCLNGTQYARKTPNEALEAWEKINNIRRRKGR